MRARPNRVASNLEGDDVRRTYEDWAPLPLRVVTGGGLAYHGRPKLFSRSGHANIVHLLRATGAPMPEVTSWAVGSLEFFGGLALVAGLKVRPVSTLVFGMTVVNVVNLLRLGGLPEPLPGCQPLPGLEDSGFYGGCTLALMLLGPGRWAVQG
jgi:putative oxidoreductase